MTTFSMSIFFIDQQTSGIIDHVFKLQMVAIEFKINGN